MAIEERIQTINTEVAKNGTWLDENLKDYSSKLREIIKTRKDFRLSPLPNYLKELLS